jgi:hypothetical protein
MFSKQQYGIYNRMVTFLSISQAGTTLATYSIISVCVLLNYWLKSHRHIATLN